MGLLQDRYDTARIEALARARRTEIAIVYEHWFEPFGGLPRGWRRLGRWTLAENIVAAGPTVSFFAVDPGAARASKRPCDRSRRGCPRA